MDALWLAIGIVGGVVGTAVIMEAMGRTRQLDPVQSTKLTGGWTLKEMGAPTLVVRDVVDLDVPAGCEVFASGTVPPDLHQTCRVHQVPEVRVEFAIDPHKERALLFTAGARKGTIALLTVEPALVSRLDSEWRTVASRAGAYVERLTIAGLAGRSGVVVETQGLVQDVLPFKDQYMIRLEDDGAVIGVLVRKDPEGLRDERILVRGPLAKDDKGYPYIDGEDIRRIR